MLSLQQQRNTFCLQIFIPYTFEKMSLIYQEIQNGAVAKSCMWKGLASNIWGNAQIFPHICMMRPLVIHDFATASFWITLYMRKISFSFLSVYLHRASFTNLLHVQTQLCSCRSYRLCIMYCISFYFTLIFLFPLFSSIILQCVHPQAAYLRQTTCLSLLGPEKKQSGSGRWGGGMQVVISVHVGLERGG
jgi:hypothetical protein